METRTAKPDRREGDPSGFAGRGGRAAPFVKT